MSLFFEGFMLYAYEHSTTCLKISFQVFVNIHGVAYIAYMRFVYCFANAELNDVRTAGKYFRAYILGCVALYTAGVFF